MQAMGFTGQGGFEEYARIRMQMQDPGAVGRALPAYLKSFGVAGAGPMTQALILQQAMGAFGAPVEATHAIEMGQRLAGIGGQTFTEADVDKLMRSGAGLARATNQVGITAAGIEAQRVAVGARAAGAIQALEKASLNIADTFNQTLGPAVYDFAYSIEDATEWVNTSIGRFLSSGGSGGGMRQ